MKYTIDIKLIDKPNSEDLCPVKLVVTISGRRAHISTGVRILKTQWKDGVVVGHKLAANYNALIRSKHAGIEKSILEKLTVGDALSINLVTKKKEYRLVPYFEQLIDDLTSKFSWNTIRGYNTELNRLKEYDSEITFSQIDTAWLRSYENHLRESVKGNSVHRSFKILKTVFNHAIAEMVTTNYPFKNYDNPKYTPPILKYLTEKEMLAFEKALLLPLDESVRRAGKYFLLGCYCGLRVSDWLRFNPEFIQGDRLILHAKKNGELVSMKMHAKLKNIAKKLKNNPLNLTEQKANQYIKVIAGHAKIKRDISTHWARHTFAVRCAEMGISVETTAALMGVHINSCLVYYKVTGVKVDKEIVKWNNLNKIAK